jgi:hypothetical protein
MDWIVRIQIQIATKVQSAGLSKSCHSALVVPGTALHCCLLACDLIHAVASTYILYHCWSTLHCIALCVTVCVRERKRIDRGKDRA